MFETYEICCQDLTLEAKDRLLSILRLSESEPDWEPLPLAIIDRQENHPA